MRKTLAFVLALAMAPAVHAGEFADAIFRPGAFAAADPVRFDRDHTDMAGTLVVTPEGEALKLVLETEEGARPISSFPAKGGNPVLLYFLENTTRAMAEATGGSPFYIRNRLREALVAAPDAPDGEVTLTPFSDDENRARMGDFADLRLRFVVDPDNPAHLVELAADTGPEPEGYHDRLTLIEETEQ